MVKMQTSLIPFLLISLLTLSWADLLTPPRNTFAPEGSTARITCGSTFNESVYFFKKGTNGPTDIPIYEGQRGFIEVYRSRFSVRGERETWRQQDLVIENVQPEDAGIYECVDEAGNGEHKSAELIVVDFDGKSVEMAGCPPVTEFCAPLNTTNLNCTYRWVRGSENETVGDGNLLNLSRAEGSSEQRYACIAECRVRDRHIYHFTAINLNISCPAEMEGTAHNSPSNFTWLLFIPIIVIVSLVGIICWEALSRSTNYRVNRFDRM